MPGKDVPRLSKRTVDAFAVVDKDAIFWDRDLPSFGVRVYTTGRKVYVVQTRGPGGPKRVSIGRHGEVPAEQARKQAVVIIDRIKQGLEPVPAPELTVAVLAERYLQGHVAVNCRASTLEAYRSLLTTSILPEFGELPIAAVDRAQVAALHYKLRATPSRANAAVGVLSRLFGLAEAWGLAPPGGNPCRSVRLYRAGKKHERYLTPGEYRRLGRLMDEGEANGSLRPAAVAAIRLLMLTGCRRNEILTLRWDDVDRGSGVLRLRAAKTGARMAPLTPEVEMVLDGIPRLEGNPWVIVGGRPGTHLANIDEAWLPLRARAGLVDVRLHDLRHSYASRALALGEGLPMIGKLLGHKKVRTTARYAHLTRDSEKASIAKIGGSIGEDILPPEAGAFEARAGIERRWG